MKKKNNHILIFGSFLAIFIVFLGFSINTLFFNRTINHVSKNYLLDNNKQLASHISYRLKSGNEFITDFADTLSRMPEFLLTEDLLARKAEAMELEGLAVLSRENATLSSGKIPDLISWTAKQPRIWNEALISYIKNSCLIFSAPVVKSGITEQIVIGVQSYRDIQSLVNFAHYQKDGVSILFDTVAGEPIMLEKSAALSITDDTINGILKHLTNLSSSLEIDIDNTYVSAEPIDGTDWLQISMIPADILVSEMAEYIIVYLVLITAGFLLLAVDLYYFKKTSHKREQFFLRDSLTEGYNREGFLLEGARLLDIHGHSSYSVACLNISDFRYINEMWGEESGNSTLRFIYHILTGNITNKELVCRSNMDHFLILLHEKEEADVIVRINQMITQINDTILLSFGAYTLDFTIGCCRLYLTNNLNSAINNAVYATKKTQKKNVCAFYNKEIARKLTEENELNELFEESVKRRDFKVYLQPKVSPVKGVPCQAEALVRWEHPEKGVIFPNRFIPMFEKNGKICALDLYMFEEVCRLVSDWIKTEKTVTKISVNLSRYHLKNSGNEVWKNYKEIKEKYHIPDGIIEIELTETMLVDQTQISFVKQVLDDFRSCGFHVALDDFGFAYSSLALLKEFEVDTLKLDRSFFINETKKSRKIVASIIQLAHSLGMCVVAEGIESEEQVNALCENKCDLIQGYVYARPLPVEDFEKWRNLHEK